MNEQELDNEIIKTIKEKLLDIHHTNTGKLIKREIDKKITADIFKLANGYYYD